MNNNEIHLKNKVIVITGGIGCGKSTVLMILKNLGYTVLSADEIAREVIDYPEVFNFIKERFPEAIKNNIWPTIDRKILGNLIFLRDKDRKDLENIMHPLIRKIIIDSLIKEENGRIRTIFIEIPLWFETQMSHFIPDKVWCISAPLDVQLRRIMVRGFTKEEATLRINSQLSIVDKAEMSDVVIENNNDMEYLIKQVNDCLETV